MSNLRQRLARLVERLHALSLRRTLLLVLFPGLLTLVGAELWLTWRTAVDAANAAYDRSLLGAIKAMDANISTESGGLGVELPYRMLEFFELTASGRVYYRVATENGLVEIGNADLPPPPRELITEHPQFSDAIYYDTPVRIGSYARFIDPPLAGQSGPQRLVIQVAETLESRQAFTRILVLQAFARDVLLVVAASGVMVLVVAWALRPLTRLRNGVQSRAAIDLTPISTGGIPADVKPLVEAINHHVERNRRQAQGLRQFVDDASHQLRTPLTTLSTQVSFALREADPQEQRKALEAIKLQLDETVRQTNQMLALARADSAEGAEVAAETVDLNALAQEVTRKWWSEARERGIDLGFEPAASPLHTQAQPALLKEALSNLLHNALRYTPRGGHVTVSVNPSDAHAAITVVDTGPGVAAQEMARLGERFFRGGNGRLPGTGLGLAIVKSVVERHGGRLQIAAGREGRGLSVAMLFPRLDDSGFP
ncbi:MAG: sensor histidine kinase N-terminal domain-containing protein [Gammaproteobacteria bacterium]|nr:sensor histidine kinase N-terminal domain-containing protein [Gammaproteobacteria bacterium]